MTIARSAANPCSTPPSNSPSSVWWRPTPDPAPAGLRSAEDQALDSLPDNHLKSAMQALPQQFRYVVYYADVEGLGLPADRGNHEHPDRDRGLASFTVADDNYASYSRTAAGDAAATQTNTTTASSQ